MTAPLWRFLDGPVIEADCLDALRALPDESIDAVVTDPPYGLEFMGAEWDAPWKTGDGFRRSRNAADAERDSVFGRTSRRGPEYVAGIGFQRWCEAWASEALRVLKPGGHMAVFGSPRTFHRLAAGIEDAGFEIRDTLMWLFGSGFPKSHNLDGERQGWGTALKPAYEPIVLARKPLAGTVAETVLAHGTGAIHIDACRIDGRERTDYGLSRASRGVAYGEPSASADFDARVGRWPANVLLDEAAAEMLDAQTGELVSGKMMPTHTTAGDARQVFGRDAAGGFTTMETYGDRGGASRFFYCAKASRGERDAGLDGFPLGDLRWSNGEQSPGTFQSDGTDRAARNHHPTVKPIELKRWLLRLLTPPGGIVLDLFAGSGSTVCAGAIERIDVIGIEREPEYVAIARARAAWWAEHPEGLPVEACVQAARRRRARTEEGQFSMFDSEPAERAA